MPSVERSLDLRQQLWLRIGRPRELLRRNGDSHARFGTSDRPQYIRAWLECYGREPALSITRLPAPTRRT